MVRPIGTLAGTLGRGASRMGLAGCLLASTALLGVPMARAAGEFIDPSGPDYSYYSIPALSADGTMFVANVYDWVNDLYTGHHVAGGGGVSSVPGFGGGFTTIRGLSGDGRYVVGSSRIPSGNYRPFLWDVVEGDILNLDLLYVGIPNANSEAWDVSGDGTRVVGDYTRPGITRAFVWIEGATNGMAGNEQMFQLEGLDDANNWSALAISDERYAAGYSDGNATTSLAVRWDLRALEAGGQGADTVLSLGSLTDSDQGYSMANDISADGTVVVGGTSNEDGWYRAFRWVEGATGGDADNVQMYDLGVLDPGYAMAESTANAVSRDGAHVVGWSTVTDDQQLAFRWSEETGMESVQDWLERNGVEVGDGLVLIDATAVSDDGQVIAGQMDSDDDTRAYIARVTGGSGSGGLMDVEEYQRSLFSTASVAGAGEFLTWLPMNGAHHRPLMQTPSLSGDTCIWATGDFASHGASQTALGLAEAGACVDLMGGNLRVGGAVGTSHSWQQLALGGSTRLGGQYVMGEIDWQPEGTPLLFSVSGMLGGWQADIHRGYSNGAATAYSDGSTGVTGGLVRLRADWLEAARLGNTTINPWVSVAYGAQHVAGFTETGGPFPARFDAQTLSSTDFRLGVTAETALSAATTLSTTFEVAHRTGSAPVASGNVIGLFDFSLGGGQSGQTWARVGAELDHEINDAMAISASVHLASNGRDPSVAGSLGFKAAF